MRAELEDPKTGRAVTIGGKAHMHQRCRICHEDLHGHPIASVDGAKSGACALGWFHLSHLGAVLSIATPTKQLARTL